MRDLTAVDQKKVKVLNGLGFDVCAGEIYGIAGVGGNGQDQLTAILTGLMRQQAGAIAIDGAGDVTGFSPRRLRDIGLACIYSDRAHFGLANDLPVADNYAISGVLAGEFGSFANVQRGRIRTRAGTAIRRI